MGLSRAVSTDRTLFEVVSYAEWRGCIVLEYRGFSNVHKSNSFHDDMATDPRFRGYRQAADINHDGFGDRAEFTWLMSHLYHYATAVRGLASTFPALTNGYGVAGHSIGDGLHLHLDRGQYSDRGHGAEILGSTGRDKGLTEAEVRTVQRTLGLPADGIYGPATLRRVAAVQRDLGVVVDALWGARTADAYRKAHGTGQPANRTKKPAPRLKQGDTGAKVRLLQAGLNRHGAHLVVDGQFGPATGAAVYAFKRAHRGWTADRICGTRVATALGFRL